MNFKILIPVSIAMSTMTTVGAFAQQPQQVQPIQQQQRQSMTPDQRADMEVQRMDSKLHLTADQKTKVKQLLVNINTQRDQNRAAAGNDPEKRKELNQSLMKQRNDGLNGILTPEQQKTLQQDRPMGGPRMQMQQQPQPGSDK